MPDRFAEQRHELAVANRILANEGIIDAFGHISVRNPKDPSRYFISRHRASELVEPSDVLEMTLDSKPVVPTGVRLYSEMVIHGEIYKARPDVTSVCHHHAPAILPFCATGIELVPLFHLGGTLGAKVPFWDSRDEFGDTNLLVSTPEEGASHARALGPHFMVLLRRHGATARRQIAAGMRVPLDLHHPQRRAAAAGHGDRHARPAVAGRGREMRRPQSRVPGGRRPAAWEDWAPGVQNTAMRAAAGLPRLKGLAEVGRPRTAGLPEPGKAPARRTANRAGRKGR